MCALSSVGRSGLNLFYRDRERSSSLFFPSISHSHILCCDSELDETAANVGLQMQTQEITYWFLIPKITSFAVPLRGVLHWCILCFSGEGSMAPWFRPLWSWRSRLLSLQLHFDWVPLWCVYACVRACVPMCVTFSVKTKSYLNFSRIGKTEDGSPFKPSNFSGWFLSYEKDSLLVTFRTEIYRGFLIASSFNLKS